MDRSQQQEQQQPQGESRIEDLTERREDRQQPTPEEADAVKGGEMPTAVERDGGFRRG